MIRKLLLPFLFFIISFFSFGQNFTDTTPGGPKTWTVPNGVTSIQLEIWGAGGAGGGSLINKEGGAGGGGGAYVSRTISVAPGDVITYSIGAGGTGSSNAGTSGGNTTLTTVPGTSLQANGGEGGQTAVQNSIVAFGNGGIASGGSTNTNGSNGTGNTTANGSGGTGGKGGNGANGGIGGAGALNDGTNVGTGTNPGGAGGGGVLRGSSFGVGGKGGNGQVKFTYTCPTYSLTSVSTTDACSTDKQSIVTAKSSAAGLPVGTYTVEYRLSYNGYSTVYTTTMTVTTAGTGTFTSNLSIMSGTETTNIRIDKITSGSCGNTISSNNVSNTLYIAAFKGAPSAGNGYASCNNWIAQWNNATVDGYYLDVAIDNAFTNYVSGYQNLYVGNVISYTLSGLAPGGTYYYRVRSQNYCGISANSNVITFTEKGNGSSNPGTISGGNTSICPGSTTQFTVSGSNPSTGTWSVFNQTGAATISSTGLLSATKPGTVTVVFTVGSGCVSSATKSFTIAGGTIGAASSTPTICVGTALNPITHSTSGFTGIGASTNLPPGLNAGFNNNTITITGTPTAPASGTYNYSISLNGGGCGNAYATGTIKVNAAPAITTQPTAPTATCEGTGTRTISVTATGTNLTYLWKKDGTAIINGGVYTGQGTATLTLTNPTTANQGNYTVDISGDCATTPITSNQAVVTVNAASSAPTGISGTTTIQSGNNTTLSVTGGSLGTGGTAEWFTGSCGGTPTGTGNSITVSPTSNTTYYVRYTGTCNTTTCASVVVTVTPPACIPAGDQIVYGTNSWIGYVYSSSSSTPPNPSTNTTLPIGANMTYIGRVEEPQLFNRDIVQGAVTGVNPQLCGMPPVDNFFVRYKMKTTVAATGTYNITLGGDDLYRLYINDQKVIEQWTGQNYTQKAINITLTAGVEYRFDVEYYEKTTDSRIQFSMGLIAGDNNDYPFGENLWKVYGFTNAIDSNTNFNLSSDGYAGYYSTIPVNINTVNSFAVLESPSFNPAVSGWQGAPVPKDYFSLAYKRHGFPCGAYKIQIAHRDNNVQIYLNENTTTPIFTGSYSNSPEFVGGGTGTVYNLNKDSKIEIRLKDYKDNAQLIINFIPVETIYTGSGPVPSNTTAITISSNTTLQTDLEVCSCTINPGITLTVPANKTLTVNQNITIGAGGKLLLQNNASLLQNSTAADAFTGDFDSFEVQRNTAPVRRYDFTFWSSPINRTPGFTLHDLSPETLADKFYSYIPGTGWKISYKGILSMEPGMGYIVRAPQNYDIKATKVYEASFIGKPNNGEYFITNVPGKNILVGNPYPSALDAAMFIKINHDADADVGALYFWTHNSPPSSAVPGDAKYNYTTADYAVYSLTGGVATSKGATTEGYKTGPTGKIASGQAFFITGSTTNPIRFTNEMRIGGNNTQFFKTTDSEDKDKNRLWLNLTNEQGAFKQALIGYLDGATNSWDINYDGPTLAGNTYVDFYSINETDKLTIQGRALPFSDTDLIPLGYVSSIVGDFTISIDHTDGLFDTQAVYLEDKTTGKTVDLRAADYTFSTTKGTFNDRFVLRYTNKTLGTGNFENIENGLLVSVKDKAIKVTSAKENIKEVTIFDINGKQLQSKNKIGSTELLISNLQAANQVLLVKVTLENEFVITKKILFQ